MEFTKRQKLAISLKKNPLLYICETKEKYNITCNLCNNCMWPMATYYGICIAPLKLYNHNLIKTYTVCEIKALQLFCSINKNKKYRHILKEINLELYGPPLIYDSNQRIIIYDVCINKL
jgi:hypothetical protein